MISYVGAAHAKRQTPDQTQKKESSYGQVVHLVHERRVALRLGLRDVVLLFQLLARLVVEPVHVVVRHAAVLRARAA